MDTVVNMHSTVATAAAARLGAALSDAQYFESGMVKPEDIRRRLELGSTKEKLDAMKRIIALISLGKDASEFFPSVVKNVVATSIDVRKLVYMYLVHYAEDKPDLALLAINSLQKDLSNPNQLIRALALKIISSIRVNAILQIVMHGITRAATDGSPYVRKTAANAIPKVYILDETSLEELLKPLSILLNDSSGLVIGSAVAAWREVAPKRYDLLHGLFRKLCLVLIDLDEWSQITVLDALLAYARDNLPRPSYSTVDGDGELDDSLIEDGERMDEPNERSWIEMPSTDAEMGDSEYDVDPDLRLLLQSTHMLFRSLNSAVILSAVSLFFHLASPEEFRKYAVKPLMHLLRLDRSTQFLALQSTVSVAARIPGALTPYAGEFFISSLDGAPATKLKMRILTLLLKGSPPREAARLHQKLFPQLTKYVLDWRPELACEAAEALGCIAGSNSASAGPCLRILTTVVISSSSPAAVSKAVAVMRRILQKDPGAHEAQYRRLAKLLASAKVTAPEARASITWLIGEYYQYLPTLAPEILRRLVASFPTEYTAVKLQTLTFAAKLVVRNERTKPGARVPADQSAADLLIRTDGDAPNDLPLKLSDGDVYTKLFKYALDLGISDRDYDVRDRARILRELFYSSESTDPQILEVYCDTLLSRNKPAPEALVSATAGSRLPPRVALGSLSEALGRPAHNFRPLPHWTDSPTEPSVRKAGEFETQTGSAERSKELPIGAAVSRRREDPESFFDSEDNDDDDDSEYEDDDDEDDDDEDEDGDGDGDGVEIRDGDVVDQLNLRTVGVRAGDEVLELAGSAEVTQGVEGNKKPGGDGYVDLLDEITSPGGTKKKPDVAPAARQRAEDHATVDGTVVEAEAKAGTSGSFPLWELLSSPQTPSRGAAANGEEEGDLIKSLSGVHLSPTADTPEAPLNWRRLLESWNADGLEIDYSFARVSAGRGRNEAPVVLRIRNTTSSPVSAISCRQSSTGPLKVEIRPFAPVASLNGGEQIQVVLTCIIHTGRPESIPLHFSTSTGTFDAEMRPLAGEILRPESSLTVGQFAKLERQLGGRFANEADIVLPTTPAFAWQERVRAKILTVAHMTTPFSDSHRPSDELLLAAVTIGSEVPVLLSIRPLDDVKNRAVLRVSCDDLLLASNLLQIVRSRLTAES